MHIFSIDNKPCLIISTRQVLFFIHSQDEKMQGFNFNEIERIEIEHKYDARKELYLWLTIKIKDTHTPYLIQASLFEESLDEVFTILNTELQGKVKLANRSQYKLQKRLVLSTLVLLLSLLSYHTLVPPTLNTFKDTALKASSKKEKSFCSLKAKVAFPSHNKKDISINRYCGLFGFWKLEDTKIISSKFLKAEFSSKTAKKWILSSQNLLKNKNYKQAFIDIDNALYLEPSNETALLYSSELYKLLGEHQKAIERDKHTLKKFPNYASVQQHLALLYQENGNDHDAYIHFQSVNRLRPSLQTYLTLAQIEEDRGFYQKAINNYESALILSPNDSYLSSTIGLSYWKIKNFKKAGKYLKKTYLLNPNNATNFLNYHEISLVVKELLSEEEKENFLNSFKDNKKAMMTYEMLNIIKLSLQNIETQSQKEIWKQRYNDIYLDWSFHELISWLEESDLDEEHTFQVASSIRFFIGYQQAYKLKHQNNRK